MPLLKYNDTRIIRRIAKESGLSVSTVYGILGGNAGFSGAHSAMVEELARAYGLCSRERRDGEGLTIGVIIPRSPGYFWNEAVAGLKKSVQDYRERGIDIKLLFRCFSSSLLEEDDEQLIEGFSESFCDGYVLYPYLRPRLWSFFAELSPHVPIVLFNDLPCEEEQIRFFRRRPNCAYIGVDHFKEGQQAAFILEPFLPEMKYIAAVVTCRTDLLITATKRVEGFTARIREVSEGTEVEVFQIEMASRTASSMLAGELEARLLDGRLDGVYVSAGFAHIAAAAIRKICRKHGLNELALPCIGHEFAPSDKPYLLDGILRGYVRQDIYRQGQTAVAQLADYLLDASPLSDTLVRSSIFIR